MLKITIATNEEIKQLLDKYSRLDGMLLENKEGQYSLVLKHNDNIVACASVKKRLFKLPKVQFQEEFIFVIDVLENEWKRKGYGTLLVEEIKRIGKDNGSYQVSGMSSITNYSVQAFWINLGFVNLPILTDNGCNESLVGLKI
jgi:N-acetylglutamate synthase-like GNAT family acetyltransferase